MAKLIGWGRTNDSVTSLAKVLQEVDLPVVTTPTCQLRTGFTNFFGNNYSLPVTESMMCVGFFDGGGQGGCYHDSGKHPGREHKAKLNFCIVLREAFCE